MSKAWKDYQEEVATFFRSLDLDASTDATIRGVRTTHAIDVLVKSKHIGFDVVWIVECKHWRARVTKLHVLALREIVSDVGADRGIIMPESGFQSDAKEAAQLTNVQLTSLDEVGISATLDIEAMRLRDIYDRVEACSDRYWAISKSNRIKFDLRPDVGQPGYFGTHAIEIGRDLLARAFRGVFPFRCEAPAALVTHELPQMFASVREILEAIEPLILELERRLDNYDTAQQSSSEKSSPD